MGRELTEKEIRRRLQEGRNYKYLYRQLKVRFDDLKEENCQLRAENATLRDEVATLKMQVAELQAMVFGKKKHAPFTSSPPTPSSATGERSPRVADSYRRPIPPPGSITTTVRCRLPARCACGGTFTHRAVSERYEEDIPLPGLTRHYQPHLVTRYRVERGICCQCGKQASGIPLSGQAVRLGPNVRLLVSHLISLGGMSYAQAANLLLCLYGIALSDGEMAAVLQHQHERWLPAYEQLKSDIRGSPVTHYDETPWHIQQADNHGYAWVMSDGRSDKTAYHLASSRGVRQAHALHGNARGVRVTDDYGAYRSLTGKQQLCWAHLFRTTRDLQGNANLPKDQAPYVTRWHEQFTGIYRDLRILLSQPHDAVLRRRQQSSLWRRIRALATSQPPAGITEPKKLQRLRAQLLRAGKARLLTCLTDNTPCDNNRAERDLRQLVLKRKRSFGSKTDKGAQALGTILSICTTTWRNNPQAGYFKALAGVGL